MVISSMVHTPIVYIDRLRTQLKVPSEVALLEPANNTRTSRTNESNLMKGGFGLEGAPAIVPC